jgi:hypothetical protein
MKYSIETIVDSGFYSICNMAQVYKATNISCRKSPGYNTENPEDGYSINLPKVVAG